MKNDLIKKGLVCAVLILFVGMSIVPLVGSLSIKRISTKENIYKSNLADDTTPPSIELTWEAYKEENRWFVKFTALCNDTSGIDRVEWALNDVVQYVDSEFPYEWIIKWCDYLSPWDYTFKGIAYEKAGNSAFDSVNQSEIIFPVIVVHINEIYGTDEEPQFRPLANVKVEIKSSIFGIIWLPFWSERTDENGTTEQIEINEWWAFEILNPVLYKVTVLKNCYHTYGCTSSKMVTTAAGLAKYYVNFTMADDGSPFIQQISKGNQQSISQQSSSILSSQNTMCMIPSTESIVVEERVLTKEQICKSNLADDTTPPVTTISFDPPKPNGWNGWYVNEVKVTLNATDDISGVNTTYYRLNGGEWEIYAGPFVINSDGDYTIEFYSIDFAGNIEDVKSAELKIDQTPPEVFLIYEPVYIPDEDIWYLFFTAECNDLTSGMDRVKFYYNGELQFTDATEPFEWFWKYYDIYDAVGIIRNPEITEEFVKVYAVIVHITKPMIQQFSSYAYDNAENSDNDWAGYWFPPITWNVHLKYLTLPGNYTGYIGKHFIRASLKDFHQIMGNTNYIPINNQAEIQVSNSNFGILNNIQNKQRSRQYKTFSNKFVAFASTNG